VHSAGERPGRRGRTPLAFTVDSAAGFVVGVGHRLHAAAGVGGRHLGGALRDVELNTSHGGPREVEEQITGTVRAIDRELGGRHGELLAMGVSTPGVVDPETSRVTSLAWHVSATGEFDAPAMLAEALRRAGPRRQRRQHGRRRREVARARGRAARRSW